MVSPLPRWSPLALALAGCASRAVLPLDASHADATTDAPPIGPGLANTGVFYRIDVRSFQATGASPTGDYAGLTSRLDYLQSLGVDALVLLPLTPASDPESGGFLPTDLFASDPAFGTVAEASALFSAAHARGLRVIVTVPLDAASAQHPAFLDAVTTRTSAHHGDFVWTDAPCPDATAPDGAPAWHLVSALGQCFWSKRGSDAPEWNYASPGVQSMAIDAVRFWLDAGADGVELGGAAWLADEIPSGVARGGTDATHAEVRALVAAAHAHAPPGVVVAQAATDASDDLAAMSADGVDVVRGASGLGDALAVAISTGGLEPLKQALSVMASGTVGFFASDERTPSVGRLADALQRDTAAEGLAAMVLLAAPGAPMPFYGDEIGLGAGAMDAQGVRSRLDPMAWDGSANRGFTTGTPWTAFDPDPSANVADEREVGGSVLETYRTLLAARRRSPALTAGAFVPLHAGSAGVLAFLRVTDSARVLVVINFDTVAHLPAVDLASAGITTGNAYELRFTYVEPGITPGNAASYGRVLPARSGRWLSIQ